MKITTNYFFSGNSKLIQQKNVIVCVCVDMEKRNENRDKKNYEDINPHILYYY